MINIDDISHLTLIDIVNSQSELQTYIIVYTFNLDTQMYDITD